jgi:isopenicillin-N epimerase
MEATNSGRTPGSKAQGGEQQGIMAKTQLTTDKHSEPLDPTSGPLLREREWETLIAPNLEEIRQSLHRGGGGPDDEAHWALVRKQFSFDHDKGHLNTGTIGGSPLYIRRRTEQLREFYECDPWIGMGRVIQDVMQAVEKVAALVNAEPGEISFTGNVTESLMAVARGLNLRRGDLVVTTDREHPGGRIPWDLAQDWNGVHVERISIPEVTEDAASLDAETIARFRETLEKYNTPRYERKRRLLSISHIFSPLARRMPVKALCALAREYGYLTYIDGAQAIGMVRLDLRDLGCDFYGNSPHKWLLAPKGTGILYVRNEALSHMKAFTTKGNWEGWQKGMPSRPFSSLGTHDPAPLCGIGFAVDFLNLIGGIDRVEERGWWLACRLRDGIEKLPGLRLITPNQPFSTPSGQRLSGSMTAFVLDGAGHIGTRLREQYELHFPTSDRWGRISTHYYNTPAQVDRIIQALGEMAHTGAS